jgi:hypothetical protein
MYLEKNEDISGHIVIIDPEIHKKAQITREQFIDRVYNVNEIRTTKNNNYLTFYFCTLDDHYNILKFHNLINHAKFDFNNRFNFAIAVQPKLYKWFKNTEYSVIEKQITFWLASLYFFCPEKREIMKSQLYKLLFEEILKLIDIYYNDFKLPDFQLLDERLLDNNDFTIFEEYTKCREKYFEQCKKCYNAEPPVFLSSPFGFENNKDWGIDDGYCFEFIESYFLEKDWDAIIIKGGKQDIKRVESRSDLWDKWKHTYATFDQRKNPVYSFYLSNPDKQQKIKKNGRETIPQEVKNAVWKRDEGKCVQCGTNEKLEFDHIIPCIKGGASTYRNLQLLCEPCNKRKYNKLGET